MSNLIPYRFRNLSTRPTSLFADDFFRPFFQEWARHTESFRVDVQDKGDHYLLEADLPGIPKEQVKIEVDNNVLSISAGVDEEKKDEKDNYLYCERRVGCFSRSFNLRDIREEDIRAEYQDGVLKLTLPKQQVKAPTARRIELN